MRRLGAMVLALMLAAMGPLAWPETTQAQQTIAVATMPPVVVETVPRSGAVDVDPGLTEIRVTFSKDMMTENMWSWVIHTKQTFPDIAGDVGYLGDGRTAFATVRLEPGRTYAIWFNSPNYRHNAFRDLQNNPAVPYLLVFQTRD